ncbi:DoxX family membrane protein [Candidatus Uhrbacteria bacterium]|nr:DoxX family membrane protein [Candidatus Uhrbacteria bacterium]
MTTSRILRYSLAALFFWFGFQQITSPDHWTVFLPEWTGYFPIPGEMLVRLNGWSEMIGAVFLITGTFVKPISVVLALHLFLIAVEVKGAIGMRDAILGMTCIALAFTNKDSWTIDSLSQK